jgi:hypothetical protein
VRRVEEIIARGRCFERRLRRVGGVSTADRRVGYHHARGRARASRGRDEEDAD